MLFDHFQNRIKFGKTEHSQPFVIITFRARSVIALPNV